ncbi:hypothetical protein ACJRO0_14210, partial [Acetobacter oryzifermentans]|uniref:hypothetical protein n=1 Tax=Acetobacter oryzifermentans TaxID=1633874 RepID=UPI0039BF3649
QTGGTDLPPVGSDHSSIFRIQKRPLKAAGVDEFTGEIARISPPEHKTRRKQPFAMGLYVGRFS